MRRFWKWLLAILFISLLLVSVFYITILGPALHEVNIGMCKTYYPDDPDCIRRLQEAGPPPSLAAPGT